VEGGRQKGGVGSQHHGVDVVLEHLDGGVSAHEVDDAGGDGLADAADPVEEVGVPAAA